MDQRGIIFSGQAVRGRAHTLHLALRIRGGMQILFKTLTGMTLPLRPFQQHFHHSHIPTTLCSTSTTTYSTNSGGHSHAIALHPHLNSSTKLIVFYAKHGDLVSARQVFDEMPERSVVSWTAMISGYSRNGRSSESLETFSLMKKSDCRGNQFTYGSALRACTEARCVRSGAQIHGCAVKSRFGEDLFVQSALVDLHLKCGSVEDARGLFERMERRDLVLWNSVIGGHAVRGLGYDAIGLFRLMLRDGVLPDHFTFGNVLKACGGVRAPQTVNQVHSLIIKSGDGCHCVVAGSLIDAYAKCKCMVSARLLYDSMHEYDLISCTALITGYSQDKYCSREASEVFYDLSRMGMRFDGVILCSMLNICADGALLCSGRQIHAFLLKSLGNYDVALGNALIDMYAKAGEIENAYRVFNEMKCKNVISWTSLIAGYGKNGYGQYAIALFQNMEDNGCKPNDVTFLSLLSACSHSGLTIEGVNYFNYMVNKYGVSPRAEHYSCLVDLLARGGLIKEAIDFICNIDIKPDTSLWGAILGACRIHGNMLFGEAAARHLFQLEPEKSVSYVVLANIYAAVGLWKDAQHTRKLLEQKSKKKDTGYSLIQFNQDDIEFV